MNFAIDVDRSGTVREALGRAGEARRCVTRGADLALSVTEISDGAMVRGYFDAGSDGPRRQTGGPPWFLRRGTTFMCLALRHASVLMATPPDKILNRNVRPLLAALRKGGAVAMYGGRDFLLVDGEIVALLGWARGVDGEVVIEAAIATEASVLCEPEAPEVQRAHLDKKVRVLRLPELSRSLAQVYAKEAERIVLEEGPLLARTRGEAVVASEVAIGRLSLHREGEDYSFAGDFFADDALEDLRGLAASSRSERVRRLRESGVTVEGVRDWPGAFADLFEDVRARGSA